jgi:WD40 repeat protein
LRFSSDGTRLLARNPNGSVVVWDPRTKKELLTLHGVAYHALSITPDDTLLAVKSGRAYIQVWDIKIQEEVWSTPKAFSAYEDCAFSPDGKRLAITLTGHGADKRTGHARVFEVGTFRQTQDLVATREGKESEVNGLDGPIFFGPGGDTIQVANQGWNLK